MAEMDPVASRRHAVYVLLTFCVLFFVCAITVSYVVAAYYGYGTGFGDGRDVPIGEFRGHGLVGDGAILLAACLLDAAIVSGWYLLIGRLEMGSDDPLPPDDGADLTQDENWYYVHVPTLTKVLTGVALFCMAGVAILTSMNLPVALIRSGWRPIWPTALWCSSIPVKGRAVKAREPIWRAGGCSRVHCCAAPSCRGRSV